MPQQLHRQTCRYGGQQCAAADAAGMGETLRHWFNRFQANRDRIEAIYDERFCRMWEFYLAGCEMAFRNGPEMVFQIQLARRRDAVPLSRDYIVDRERGSGIASAAAA